MMKFTSITIFVLASVKGVCCEYLSTSTSTTLCASTIISPVATRTHKTTPKAHSSHAFSTPLSCTAEGEPSYTFGTFAFSSMTQNRYATPVTSPVHYTPYASNFGALSTLITDDLTYTTWKYVYNSTAADSADPYGQYSYRKLWGSTTFIESPLFTTTPTPTPVAKTELVFPPPLYQTCGPQACVDCHKLPKDFIWGVASSAWQIEGGLQVGGRSPSILDVLGTFPGTADANRADMQYFLYKQDILRLAAIGIPYYSFSISWSRVIPFGFAGTPVNTEAIDHYTDLINFCIANGVTPIVTLTHVDTPAVFANAIPGPIAGQTTGYNHPKFVESYIYYAKIIMTRFADRVPVWFTFNEPNINQEFFESYSNVIMANAQIWHFYHEEINGTGLVSFKFANNIATPFNFSNPEDHIAANRYNDYLLGLMGNTPFLGLNYPSVVLSTNGSDALPKLSEEDIAYINGTTDFFAVDPYTAVFATTPSNGIGNCAANISDPLWPICVNTSDVDVNDWLIGAPSFAYAYITPTYFRQALRYYNDVFKPRHGVFITEFGFNPAFEANGTLDQQRFDFQRTTYYQELLSELVKAVWEDGVKVMGALGWSIMDNNEFGSYEQHYGMQTVNRTTMERRYKRSMFDYVDFFHKHISS